MKTIKTKSRKEFDDAVKKVFDTMMSMSREELLKDIEKFKDSPRSELLYRAWNIDEEDSQGTER